MVKLMITKKLTNYSDQIKPGSGLLFSRKKSYFLIVND